MLFEDGAGEEVCEGVGVGGSWAVDLEFCQRITSWEIVLVFTMCVLQNGWF